MESSEDDTMKRDLANLLIVKPDGTAMPLFYEAATNGRHEILKLLLPWIRDDVLPFKNRGVIMTPFKTCYDGHTEVVKLLEDGRLNPYVIGDVDAIGFLYMQHAIKNITRLQRLLQILMLPIYITFIM